MEFREAVERVLVSEGGYQRNPKDRGNWTGGKIGVGELRGTKYGISAAAYPSLDIRNLSREAAIDIYLRDYWNPCGAEFAPGIVRYPLFDAAVNCGVRRAVQFAQGAIGVTVDGIVGPKTRAALSGAHPIRTLESVMAFRRRHHARDASNNPSQRDFLPGWIIRCEDVRADALAEYLGGQP